nr:AGE family epimerase/isomerase [uncultured Marinifilum sp.]
MVAKSTIDFSLLKTELENELFNSVIPFWEKYSVDKKYGGYFNCIDKDGGIYDTNKYMWLHGRQVWMFSKLYNTVNPQKSWLDIAKYGLDFMEKNAITENGRVYFSLNQEGDPVYLQRKIFTECFYAMALAEYAYAVNSKEKLEQAKEVFQFVWHLSKNSELVGGPSFKGEANFQILAVPMIMLNLIEEVYREDYNLVQDKIDFCISKIKMHLIDQKVYENVLIDGSIHDSFNGRLLNPGHAIEAGWFLKHWARKLDNKNLSNLASNIIRWSLNLGWDKEHGGIYYFLDSKGYSPTQLEWDRKLWWPHCEALYACLLNYTETKTHEDLALFKMVKDYTFSHFPDEQNGEWFGYLDREGRVSQRFKGGPYKGCFHVPRALYLCVQLLNKIDNK